MSNLQELVDAERKKFFEQQIKVNLAVVGGTGVGKSSLINHIFGKEVASISNGRPQTRGVQKYEAEHEPIIFFDTEGYEISESGMDNSNFNHNVVPYFKNLKGTGIKSEIHLVWYCISTATNRITSYDIDNIIKLRKELDSPVAVILTQCDLDELTPDDKGVFAESVKAELKNSGLNAVQVFETTTESESGAGDLDLEALLEWSRNSLTDERLQTSFIASQKKSLEQKRQAASNWIVSASGLAAAAGGFNPIPGSDAAVIGPIQVGLSVRLVQLYGFGSFENTLITILKSSLLPMLGKATAASLSKLVPVVGQFINAAVAGSLTAVTGYALDIALSKAYLEYLETGKEPLWSELLSSENLMAFVSLAKAKTAEVAEANPVGVK